MKDLIEKAIQDAGDTIVIRMVYQNEDGVRKRRFVSPYEFAGPDAFHGMCLTTGDVRLFKLARCSECVAFHAHEVEIPMPMETVDPNATD